MVLLLPSSMSLRWHGAGMLGIGVLSIVLVTRGFGQRRPWVRRDAPGPTFNTDDPEIADLPPTTTTQLSEQMRQARERRKRAHD